MSQLSEKELNTIKDLLSEEELLVKKFQMLAQHAETEDLKGSPKTLIIALSQVSYVCIN